VWLGFAERSTTGLSGDLGNDERRTGFRLVDDFAKFVDDIS
jgi:hypothetical protein